MFIKTERKTEGDFNYEEGVLQGLRDLLRHYVAKDWAGMCKSGTYVCMMLREFKGGNVSFSDPVKGGAAKQVYTGLLDNVKLPSEIMALAEPRRSSFLLDVLVNLCQMNGIGVIVAKGG
jgi:hypothetical protein